MRGELASVRLLTVSVAMVVVAVMLPGCSGASAAATPASVDGQRAIATSIAARAARDAGSQATPARQAEPKSVADIMASVPTSPFLDGKHLAAEVGCEGCHGTLPANGKPDIPSTAKCLSCHWGSYDALAGKTARLGSMNPHKAHIGKLDCDQCHGVHKPFEYACNNCHDFPIPEKYRSQTPS